MKTIIQTIFAICTLFAISANAQDKLNLSIGLEEGIPLTTVAKFSSFVTGVSVQGEYRAIKELGITISGGYRYFVAKEGGKGLSLIPVTAGLRFYLVPKVYLSGQAGASFYTGNGSNTYLTYAQGIGFKPSKRVDLLAKYETVNIASGINYAFAGLRIAYVFGK